MKSPPIDAQCPESLGPDLPEQIHRQGVNEDGCGFYAVCGLLGITLSAVVIVGCIALGKWLA